MNEASHPNKWIITITVIIGTLMSTLDSSIVNVAIPYMRGSLGASVEEITWVATGYMLSNVITMPIIAMLSARFGRKRFYLFSIFLFTASSILCGMAQDITSMVIYRIAQGIGGGALIIISQAIMRETFPPEEQGTAMGLYGLGVILGPAFAPTLGGWLTDCYSWPWIFYINVPVGILNILMVMRFISDPPYLVRDKGKIDFLGVFFMTMGLGALQVMLEKGEQKDWFASDLIIILAFTAAGGLLLFVWRELTTDRPAVDLRILKNLPFASGTALGGVLGLGLYGSIFLLPLFLQQLLGYPALDSGLTLMPRSLAMAIAMPVAGRVYNKVGPRALISSGLSITAISLWMLSRISLDVGFWDLCFPQLLQGMGFGMVFVALSTAALSTIEKHKLTDAAGLYNVVRQVFGSIGIALAITLLNRGWNGQRAILAAKVTSFSDISSEWFGTLSAAMISRGVDPVTGHSLVLRILDGEIMRQAGMLAYNRILFFAMWLFVFAVPFAFIMKKTTVNVGE